MFGTSQPPPAPSSSAVTPTVIVERPPPGLARGPFASSPVLVVSLGLVFAATGLTYLGWRVVRWLRRRNPAAES